MALLQETFPGCVISRHGDLTPLDCFLWGYAEDRVYADQQSTLDHLKTNIRQDMTEIPPNMCQKMVENYLKKINACNTSPGGRLNDIGFHTYCQRSNLTIKKK